jgi:hypothetical protein
VPPLSFRPTSRSRPSSASAIASPLARAPVPDHGSGQPPRGCHAPTTVAVGAPVGPASRPCLTGHRPSSTSHSSTPFLIPRSLSKLEKPSGFRHHRTSPHHPPVSFSATTPPFPDSPCAQLRLAFLLVLAPSPPNSIVVRLD